MEKPILSHRTLIEYVIEIFVIDFEKKLKGGIKRMLTLETH